MKLTIARWMAGICFVALSIAAVMETSLFLAKCCYAATFLVFLSAILYSRCCCGPEKEAWFGFGLLGIGYLVLATGVPTDKDFPQNEALLTANALKEIAYRIREIDPKQIKTNNAIYTQYLYNQRWGSIIAGHVCVAWTAGVIGYWLARALSGRRHPESG